MSGLVLQAVLHSSLPGCRQTVFLASQIGTLFPRKRTTFGLNLMGPIVVFYKWNRVLFGTDEEPNID